MSSALLDEATRIAREFDYPADQVQRGVEEYIKQSNEGLAQENTTLSQIPTFVTAVPNGTEKVHFWTHDPLSTEIVLFR
jgi:hexokinase